MLLDSRDDFYHTEKATSFSLINDHGLNIVYLKDIEGRHSLIVPDKQMHDFMFLLDFSPSGVEVLNKNLKRGDRVRVIKGPLQGLEGELVRLRDTTCGHPFGRSCVNCNVLYSGFLFGTNRVEKDDGERFILCLIRSVT